MIDLMTRYCPAVRAGANVVDAKLGAVADPRVGVASVEGDEVPVHAVRVVEASATQRLVGECGRQVRVHVARLPLVLRERPNSVEQAEAFLQLGDLRQDFLGVRVVAALRGAVALQRGHSLNERAGSVLGGLVLGRARDVGLRDNLVRLTGRLRRGAGGDEEDELLGRAASCEDLVWGVASGDYDPNRSVVPSL